MFREFRELISGARKSAQNMQSAVSGVLNVVRAAESHVVAKTGLRLEKLKMLEIGTGQLPRQIAYFAAKNDVIGIDLDVVPTGLEIGKYFQVLRRNGAKRLVKTVGRKALGYDRKFDTEFRRQLGGAGRVKPKLIQMDATKMQFPDDSFDFVYSFDVFEHLPDPEAVLNQVVRVLKPGGVSFTYLHPYTSDSGCHDLRINSGQRGDLPFWPHLRAAHSDKVHSFAYLNRLRLAEWEFVFERAMPSTDISTVLEPDLEVRNALVPLRHAEELSEYTDDELVTYRLLATWQKPG